MRYFWLASLGLAHPSFGEKSFGECTITVVPQLSDNLGFTKEGPVCHVASGSQAQNEQMWGGREGLMPFGHDKQRMVAYLPTSSGFLVNRCKDRELFAFTP